jgi:hypothetical protein
MRARPQRRRAARHTLSPRKHLPARKGDDAVAALHARQVAQRVAPRGQRRQPAVLAQHQAVACFGATGLRSELCKPVEGPAATHAAWKGARAWINKPDCEHASPHDMQ